MPSIAVSAVIWLPSWVAIDFGIMARPGVKFGSWVRKQRIEGVVDGVVMQDVVGDGDIMSFGIVVVVGLSILMLLALAFVVVLKVIVMVMLDGMVVGTATTLSPVGYVAIAPATFIPMDVLVLEAALEEVIMLVVGDELVVLPSTEGEGIAAAAVGGDELPVHVFQFVFPMPIEDVIAGLVADEEPVHIFQVLEAAGVVELEGPIDVSESRETPGGPDH